MFYQTSSAMDLTEIASSSAPSGAHPDAKRPSQSAPFTACSCAGHGVGGAAARLPRPSLRSGVAVGSAALSLAGRVSREPESRDCRRFLRDFLPLPKHHGVSVGPAREGECMPSLP